MNYNLKSLDELRDYSATIQIIGNQEAPKMPYKQALKIGEEIVKLLEPYCERIEIAGSIRRKKLTVKDIEIVCIPKHIKVVERDLFGETISIERHPKFVEIINSWKKIKGCPKTQKYFQRELPQGIKVDIFTTTPESWGLTLAVRTGSADYTHHELMIGLIKRGCRSIDGMVMRNGKTIPILEEKDLFDLIGIDYISPDKRSW